MEKENVSLDFRLKKIDETRIYPLQKTKKYQLNESKT